MKTTTIQRINRLSAERAKLYSIGLNGRRGDLEIQRQIDEVTQQLDQLWDLRRGERAGRLDGIDLLVERSYANVYGGDFREAVAPEAVDEEEGEPVALVA